MGERTKGDFAGYQPATCSYDVFRTACNKSESSQVSIFKGFKMHFTRGSPAIHPPPLPPTTPSVGCLCHHRYQSHHLCSKPNHRCTHFMPFQLRDRLMNISRVARAQAAVDHHNLLKRKTKTPPSIRIRNGMPTD